MKRILKQLASLTATALVLPAALLCRLGIAVLGADKGFPGWSQGFSLIPGLTGVYLRRAFYKLVLPSCGDGACLTFGTILSHPTARIGRNVYVGAYCSLGDVELEDDVLLASNVSVMNGSRQHGIERLDVPIREQPGVFERVTIGRDSWIGERATIAANVGRHCVIGAGAVVTKPIPDYSIAIGVPARVVRDRRDADECVSSPPLGLSDFGVRDIKESHEHKQLASQLSPLPIGARGERHSLRESQSRSD